MGNRSSQKTYFDETVLQPLTIQSKGVVYKDSFKKIERIIAKFDGFKKEYFVSDFGEKAAVLVIRDNHVLLARQYRLLINQLSYEIPGGKVDESERPEEAAIRECLEETGVSCINLQPLIVYDPDLEYTKNRTYVFYSNEMENNQTQPLGMHKWMHLNDCLKMIEHGEITDSLSIITILAYKLKESRI